MTANQNNIEIDTLRHSAAHVLAQSVLRIDPKAAMGIGPVTETGFYYDFNLSPETAEIPEKKLFNMLNKEIEDILSDELPFTQIILPRDEAINMLYRQGQVFKTELVENIEDTELSFFRTGEEFMDLCRGPHVAHTGKIGAIKLTSMNNVHWLNNENRPLLTRISGVAFRNNAELKEYEDAQQKLKENYNLKVAQRLQLVQSKPGQGHQAFTLLPRGLKLQSILHNKLRVVLEKEDFQEIGLWQTWESSYWERSAFSDLAKPIATIEDLVLQQDSLPNFLDYLVYAHLPTLDSKNNTVDVRVYHQTKTIKPLSAQDSKAKQDPQEGLYLSSEAERIAGQIVCPATTTVNTIKEIIGSLTEFYRELIIENISLRYASSDSDLTDNLIEICNELKIDLYKTERDVATNSLFLELCWLDPYNKVRTLSSLNINNEVNIRLAALLRSWYGRELPSHNLISFHAVKNSQHLLASVLEARQGYLGFDLSPVQVVIVPAYDTNFAYAGQISRELQASGLRVFIDKSDEQPEKKMTRALEVKYPFIISVGNNEMQNNAILVKDFKDTELGLMKVPEFLQKLSSFSYNA